MPRGQKQPVSSRDKLPVRHIEVSNFLSLKHVSVDLSALNVLVGPNGGGKSNFLSVFRFLGEVARTDLLPALQSLFGGYERTIFNGPPAQHKKVEISLSGEVTEHSSPIAQDEYKLSFYTPHRQVGLRSMIRREEVLLLKRSAGRGRRITLTGSKYEFSTLANVRRRSTPESPSDKQAGEIESDASALSVLRRIGKRTDTMQVNELAEVFEDLRLFDPVVQAARRPSLRERSLHLTSDASNLAAVLKTLREEQPGVLSAIEDDMRLVLPGFKGFHFEEIGGAAEAVRVDLIEKALISPTPMARASFGTVRAIALFTMLRDEHPPRLTCLEEVDHGLHPHALDVLVERLRDASQRSQLIIATHSPALVNRLASSELIIFERDTDDGSSRVTRLNTAELDEMKGSSGLGLGELWFSGSIGGVPT